MDAVTPDGQVIAELPLVDGSGSHSWDSGRDTPIGVACTIGDRLRDGSPLPDLSKVWLRVSHRINTSVENVALADRAVRDAAELMRVARAGSRRYVWNADGTSSELDGNGTVLRTNLASRDICQHAQDALTTLTADGSFYYFEEPTGLQLVAGQTYTISWDCEHVSGPDPTFELGTGPERDVAFNWDISPANGNLRTRMSTTNKVTFTPDTYEVDTEGPFLAYRIRYGIGNAAEYRFGRVHIETGSTATPYFDGDTPDYGLADAIAHAQQAAARAAAMVEATRPHIIATVVPTDAPRKLTTTTSQLAVKAADPTHLLARAKLRRSITYPAATPIAETVRALIANYTPLVHAVIHDTDETLRENLTYDAGTPILTVINALLKAAGYNPLTPQPDGTLTSTAWTPPADRPTALHFADNAGHGAYMPELDIDDGRLQRPNEVIARTRGGQDSAPIVGRWPDVPPVDPIAEEITVDAASIEVARLLARQYHDQLQGASAATSIEGPWQPIQPQQVAGFSYNRHGIRDRRMLLTALQTRWQPSTPTVYDLQEVPNESP